MRRMLAHGWTHTCSADKGASCKAFFRTGNTAWNSAALAGENWKLKRQGVNWRPATAALCAQAGNPLDDLRAYDPAAMAWTDLSAAVSGSPPPARASHGFTSAGGRLYVHGGTRGLGEGGARGWREADRFKRQGTVQHTISTRNDCVCICNDCI